jgi:hypothetical protein
MDLMLIRMFQMQVEEQCSIVLRANSAIEAGSYQTIWIDLQALVLAAANLSKLLWGQEDEPDVAVARQPLRASVGVEDSSPLRFRKMRNNFEHIDARIDKWWKDSPGHNFADRNIGPYPMISGLQRVELFRQYDPAAGNLWFWGEPYNVRAIAEEVQRIYPKVAEESAKPHWETPASGQ